jgi:endoglucanase
LAFLTGVSLAVLGVNAASGCDNAQSKVPFSCPVGLVQASDECIEAYSVSVNSVGYMPSQLKRASYQGRSATFHLREVGGERLYTGQAVFPAAPAPGGGAGGAAGAGGEGGAPGGNVPPSMGNVLVADFTDFDEPGTYYIEVEGGGRSPEFRIARDVYDVPLDASMLGLYGQRCGVAVRLVWEGETFRHGECHLDDGDLTHSGIEHEDGEIKDGKGGWHDAGDYGKYTVNAAFSAAQMLKAWEHFRDKLENRAFAIPEEGGSVPDLLDETRFQMEWLLKMQFDDGQVSHKLTATDFTTEIMPSVHGDRRYFTTPSTAATADLVAVLAQAARIYDEYDSDFAQQMLDAATLSLDYLSTHEEHVSAPLAKSQGGVFATGTYGDGDSRDERLWAQVEYWETTGDSKLLEEIEESIGAYLPQPNWDWPNMVNLALYTYALSERDGRDAGILETVRESILANADELVAAAAADAYGRALDEYYWGSNGLVARATMNLAVANKLEPKPEYVDTMTQQVDHLLGRNPFARSYVTGVGYFPPQAPHHRPSIADGVTPPWPGHLVGGPNGSPTSWNDDKDDYESNEVAINWTTAMVYALVSVMP